MSAMEYESVDKGQYFFISRSMDLEGRANIFLGEKNGGTLVKVNVRYIVNKKAQVKNNLGQLIDSINHTISFNTNGNGQFPNSPTKCYSNGNFEREILNLLED